MRWTGLVAAMYLSLGRVDGAGSAVHIQSTRDDGSHAPARLDGATDTDRAAVSTDTAERTTDGDVELIMDQAAYSRCSSTLSGSLSSFIYEYTGQYPVVNICTDTALAAFKYLH